MTQLSTTSTHFGNVPAITRHDPADGNADILTDAANVAAIALREQSTPRLTHDDDVTVEVDGDEWVVTVPYTIVRLPRSAHHKFPDQIAKWALEETGLSMLAASRATEIVWRDVQRVAKS
jgi:hypothetical protein